MPFDKPAPDLTKIQTAWEKWEKGEEQPGRTLASLKTAGLDEVTGETVSVTGFCMGGGLTLLAPTICDRIDRAAAFYPAMPWPDYAPDWSGYA
ncbi:MAG: hypothetical protein EBY79_03450, partial [Actinobacteria bacterium]|nr:hypothetical protein [Actinomycetota bacterium]